MTLSRTRRFANPARAYRLTSTLVPPAPGPAMRAPSPFETTFTHSVSLSWKYDVARA